MSHKQLIDRLEPVFNLVDQEIRTQLDSDVPFVSQVCKYILLSKGKRIRPTLFVLAARMCGLDSGFEVQISPAFEYVHTATLLHDDVVDGGELRRGRPAAHLVYGNSGVILVGDFLLAKSLALGTRTHMMEFMEVMSRTVSHMAEGEVLQLLHAHDAEITEAEYERVIYRKTGALIEAACYLGAVLAKAPKEFGQALTSYGRGIGLAFQIIDDALDYLTTSAEFGKPVGHDLDEGKITLPLIRTLAQADAPDRSELLDLILKETRSPEEFNRIMTLIKKHHGLEQSIDRASALVKEAQDALNVFPDSEEKSLITALGDYVISRRK